MIYNIADINVYMEPVYDTLKRQSLPYLINDREFQFSTFPSKKFLIKKQSENPHLSLEECEYIWTGSMFYDSLIDFNGLLLHASAVAYENKAYLFSASCGVGKSTHARLWRKYFGEENIKIINDDKPAIRLIDNQFYVFGTPWSGKTDNNLNIKVPLCAIYILSRSEDNKIKKANTPAALYSILNQTIRTREHEKLNRLLTLLDKLIQEIPVFEFGCNMSFDAVKLSYETMEKGVSNE